MRATCLISLSDASKQKQTTKRSLKEAEKSLKVAGKCRAKAVSLTLSRLPQTPPAC